MNVARMMTSEASGMRSVAACQSLQKQVMSVTATTQDEVAGGLWLAGARAGNRATTCSQSVCASRLKVVHTTRGRANICQPRAQLKKAALVSSEMLCHPES